MQKKHLTLDQKKIDVLKHFFRARSESEAIDKALTLVLLQCEWLGAVCGLIDEQSSRQQKAKRKAGTRRGITTWKQQQAAIQQEQIMLALRESKGNRTKAAARLGMSRRTIYNKIKEFGIG